mgnify:CR=1 FL=1
MFKKRSSPTALPAEFSREPQVEKALRGHWPLVQNLFRDVIGAYAHQALGNDALMRSAGALVYKMLPPAVRLILPEAVFLAVCLRGRDQILRPLLRKKLPVSAGAPQSLAEQIEWKSQQFERESRLQSPTNLPTEAPAEALTALDSAAEDTSPEVQTPGARVILSVKNGPLAGQKWEFDEHQTVLLGRHAECTIQLPNDDAHKTVSRHHALLEVAPPLAQLRDFGSLNGTFVNEHKIGARQQSQSREEAQKREFPQREVRDGDKIRIGQTTFAVQIEKAPNEKNRNAAPKAKSPKNERIRSAPKPRIKTVSRKDFEILGELGRGGMGQVFLARDKRNGARVALKIMLPNVASEERSRAVFAREIALTQSLKHPNVVQMHDFGVAGEEFFFTLEFCEVGSLAHFLAQNEEISLRGALHFTDQVLCGLEYLATVPVTARLKDGSKALANGVVHRDLKPANILLAQNGDEIVAKISDVGLSKAFDVAGLSGLTMTGSCAGTPHFMPRQQLLNYRFAKPEVDVWAAAATLYFMLTTHTPRDFRRDADPFKTVLTSQPVPIAQRNLRVPEPLAEVIDRALRDEGELFYKSARELRNDLRRVAAIL